MQRPPNFLRSANAPTAAIAVRRSFPLSIFRRRAKNGARLQIAVVGNTGFIMLKLGFHLIFSIFILSYAAAAQSTLVVDNGAPPGAYTTIQGAVDAAADGDTILIKSGSGSYGGFTVTGDHINQLNIVADTNAIFTINGPVSIDDIHPRGNISFHRVKIAPALKTPASVSIYNCAGNIWFTQCIIDGHSGPGDDEGDKRAVQAGYCLSVIFSNCSVSGGHSLVNASVSGVGGRAITANATNISAWNTTFTGGDSSSTPALFAPVFKGATAVQLADSNNYFSGCTIRGGNGSSAFFGGGAGGDGLYLYSFANIILSTCVEAAGIPGTSSFGQPGPIGQALIVNSPAQATIANNPVNILNISSPVREGQPIQLNITSAVPELAFIVYSNDSQPPTVYSPIDGPLLVDINTLAFDVFPGGPSIPAGTTGGIITAPILPPTVQSLRFFVQTLVSDPAFTTFEFGDCAVVTILDAAF